MIICFLSGVRVKSGLLFVRFVFCVIFCFVLNEFDVFTLVLGIVIICMYVLLLYFIFYILFILVTPPRRPKELGPVECCELKSTRA